MNDTKVDRAVPSAIIQDKSRRDGAIHPPFGQRLHHVTPAWVPDGARFHIRIRTAPDFTKFLTNPALGKALLDSVAHYHKHQRWHVTLCLLMPDHLHAILSFPAQESMARLIGEWKRFHAKTHAIRWQDNFFDHRLRNDAEADLKYEYIRQNPVVKGLCEQPEDWPWFIGGSRCPQRDNPKQIAPGRRDPPF